MIGSDEIEIEFGEETETVLQSILSDIDDKVIEGINIRRKLADPVDLASEPTTTAVILGGLSLIYVGRCIERFLENRRQFKSTEMILRAYTSSNECGEAMTKLQLKHADLIRYSPLLEPPLAGLAKVLRPTKH